MWYHSLDTTYSTKAPADQLPCSRVKAPLNAGVNIYQNQLHDKDKRGCVFGILLVCFYNSHTLLTLQHVEGNWHTSECRIVLKNLKNIQMGAEAL